MICEDFPTLEGRQVPHNESVFAGDTVHAEKAIELARRVGAASMPWQKRALSAILSTTAEGRWTHPDCCLLIPRQNGKSEVLIYRCLYGLFKLGETILYTAQRWKTARDAWKRTMSLIKARAWLSKRVTRSTCSQGEGIIEINGGAGEPGGASISFGTRSNDTGRGLTQVDLIVYDEAYNLADGEISAMSFTQMAAGNPQSIYASSAVNKDEHPNGAVLAAVRVRGLSREPGLYFAEYMAPEDMPHDSEETWKYANPSYGVVQTADKIRKIMRNLSTAAGRKGFGVEALGRGDWPVESRFESYSVISEEQWSAMVDPAPNLVGPIALALDLSIDRRWWVIAAAQRTDTGRVHIEIGYFQSASHAEVVDFVAEVVAMWDPCALVIDRRSPAMVVEPLLIAAGIEPETTNAHQMVTACGGFYDDAVGAEQLLSHGDQPALTEAVEGAAKRTLPGGDWAWDKQADVIISPLIAATLARWALVAFGDRDTGPAATPSVEDESFDSSEFDVMTAAF